MDRLETCIDTLRMVAEQSDNPNFIVVTRKRINEFVNAEIPGGRVSIERLARAIEVAEAEKRRQDEDWTAAKEYVRSLLQRARVT
jgi:hypothetical protein